ncbi:TetR/AcrR family transcriptional regulator [Microbacterium telephonicum]|uniref:TetR family transcriptional regulator n=1 Tax=Microbacterium telephonicum TaxID=1714841 RepID=A0A498C3K6_9MICO|nr:TetR/AcrR family transcriptional regulator [Microbacterium telephonicum]RLK49559.1 TetR family transcriptional regulator [Microbacterium telephonicum]
MTSGTTPRDRAKARRHDDLVREAARLFAERGFAGVSLEELGAAVGVSGPAVYRHFAGKQAVLAEILLGASRHLHDGGAAVLAGESDADAQLRALIAFHIDFAVSAADVIRVQDRDLASLADDNRHAVRRLQREYVDMWVDVLARRDPQRTREDLRVRAHAAFGLMNSTPHTGVDTAVARPVLGEMALAALTV